MLLASCGNEPTYSGGVDITSRSISTDTIVNVSKIDRGFILSSGRPNEIVDYGDYHTLSGLSIADQYYLVYDFEFYSRNETDGTLLLKASLEFEAITIFDAFLISSESGSSGYPIPYLDPVTNKQMNKIEQAFRIPETAGEVEQQRIIFKINPTTVGTSTMRMNFIPEEQTNVKVLGSGSDGCTIPMDVMEYVLERPTIRFENRLAWDHIKGADYYKIYANGECLKNDDGSDFVYDVPPSVYIGDELTFDRFGEFGIYGSAVGIKIMGFSKRTGFTDSPFSQEIFVAL